jgi:hypothetical protein
VYAALWQSELHHASNALAAAKLGQVSVAWELISKMKSTTSAAAHNTVAFCARKADVMEAIAVATRAEALVALFHRTQAPPIKQMIADSLVDLQTIARTYPVFRPRALNLVAKVALCNANRAAARAAAREAMQCAGDLEIKHDQELAARTLCVCEFTRESVGSGSGSGGGGGGSPTNSLGRRSDHAGSRIIPAA